MVLSGLLVPAAGAAVLGLAGLGLSARRFVTRPARGGPVSDPAECPALPRIVHAYRSPLRVAVLLLVAGAVVELASPWPLKLAVDNAVGRQPLPDWLSFLAGLSPAQLIGAAALAGVLLVASGGLLGYLASFLLGGAAERVGGDLRVAAFAAVHRAPARFHDGHPSGDLVSRLLTDVGRYQDSLVARFETLLPESLTLLGMLAVLFAVDVQLALAALIVVPLLALYAARMRPRIRAAQRVARDRAGELSAEATDVVRNVRAVQVFGARSPETERFRAVSDRSVGAALHALDVSARYSPLADLVLAAGSGLLLWLGALRVLEGRLSIGTLLVVLAYSASLYQPVRSLSRLSSTLAKGAASRDRLIELFAAGYRAPVPVSLAVPSRPVGVELCEVTFGYRPDRPVLRGLDLHVLPGEFVAIMGPTGGGKSTLLSLVLRNYEPERGVVELGGLDTRRLEPDAVPALVSVVPQEAWLLDRSLADNIALGRPGASRAEIEAAGAQALVDEFARGLPEGYDTRVGEAGALLSGGQRRRVALARALLRDAPVLLLDEPTVGLDAAAERKVREAIRRARRGRTVLLVTHDAQLAALADRVVHLLDGRVDEEPLPSAEPMTPPRRLVAVPDHLAGGR